MQFGGKSAYWLAKEVLDEVVQRKQNGGKHGKWKRKRSVGGATVKWAM